MSEYDFAYEHRQEVTAVVGTLNATLIGPAPPQQSYEIVEVVVTQLGGTVGGNNITGRLQQFATLQGYTGAGTVAGTIVESFDVGPGVAFRDGNGAAPIAKVNPGCNLYAVTDAIGGSIGGSVIVKVFYRPVYWRG